MIEVLERIPATEEAALIARVKAENLPVAVLRCEYTRQKASGVYTGNSRFKRVNISYDLMLCRLCGNLEGSANNTPYCPHKLRVLQERVQELLPR